MRRLSLVVLLAMLASLIPTPGPGGAAYAATFRSFVAQVPAIAGTGSVRIWMNSDTALGETAGVEYNPVGTNTYVKVLGSFDSSFAGANWRADIPGFAAGTQIRYQLFTRNQSGQDYGFSGFNWGYTTSGAQCAGAAAGDNNVFYAGLFHDSFSASYRSPGGPVPANGGSVTLRLRTCQNDVQGASVRVWNDRTNSETVVPMTADGTATDPSVGPVQLWRVSLPIPTQPSILYYSFRATDGTASGYYRDDDPKFLGGGFGQAEATQSVAYDNSYQISAFDPAFATPEWMQRAVIYQIFPDRFRDGDPANNPQAGRFSYGGNVAIVRSNSPTGAWNTAVCDPRSKNSVAALNCEGRYGDNFYGGDLRGITQKIEDGYFSSLGVTLLYLNPIFRAPSNHKYDTANFMEIDPDFGTLADFQAMVAAANARGIRIMLDGVFNHTSSDSPYFDRYSRFNAQGQLTAPNGGANDGSGACEAVSAPFRSWFYFEGDANTTISNPGGDGGTIVRCADAQGTFTRSYEAWYGYSSLPKIRSGLPTVRDYFYGNADAVGPYWTRMGASGWRFDVGADVDPGLTNDAGNDYWEGFRAAVRNPALSGKSDTVMLGEEWGDGSPWLLGNEWDSVMNYRFRSAVLGWMFTGCSGNGCTNGAKFQENDSNDNSSSGAIFSLSPSQFNARLRSIHEDYPANAFKAMMNLPGSHDTQRVRFLLKKINNDNDGAAVQRMKEWWLFAFTYAGAPTLYYGDEVGLSHDGVWDGSQFQDDPYNRTPFPWPDASGSAYTPDTDLQVFARTMASIRHSYRALQDGDVQHGLVIDDAQGLYGFARTNGQQTALVLLNRSGSSRSATFSGLNAAPYNLPDGTVLVDAINGGIYTVSGGSVDVGVTPTWGRVLLEQAKIETPAAITALKATPAGANVRLSWPMVTADSAGQPEVITGYQILRNGVAVATVANPAFGGDPSYTDAGAAAGNYTYAVRACNAAGKCAGSNAAAVAGLSVGAAGGTYAGNVTLTATLTAAGGGVAGKAVSFSLNGSPAGTATTDANGVASVTVSLGGVDAGSYPAGVAASFAGDEAYNAASASAALTVAKASTTTAVSCAGGAFSFDGAAQTPCTATVSGPGGLSEELAVAYSSNTNAGTATASASYAESANYLGSADSASFTIAKAATVTTVTCAGGPFSFDGAAQTPCSATVSGPGLSQSLPVSYADNTDAGTATASASYAGGANYLASSGGASFTITKAATATAITCPPSVSYTGAPQTPCTATVSGPGGLSEALTVTYSDNTNAGSATASASYAESANYLASSGTKSFEIGAVGSTIEITCPASVTYTGSAQEPCTARVTGVGGLDQAVTVSYSANTNAGTATATASYAGDANHADSSSSKTFTIDRAATTTTVSCPASVSYTGSPLTPCTATVSGPGGLSQPVAVSYSANTDAGAATASASYAGGANYLASADSASFTIARATTITTVSCPASVSYTGSPLTPCTATVTGPGGLSASVDVVHTDNVNAGTAAASASYAESANYLGSADSASFTIAKAATVTTVTCAGGPFSFDGAAQTPCTATVSGPGLSQSLPVSYTDNTGAGTATASASYAGGANHLGSSDSATFTIARAATITTVSCPASVSYTGSPLTPCTATVSGPGGLSQPVAITYSNNTGTGTATASASYAGSANYLASSGSATFSIAAAPTAYSFTGFFAPVDNPPVVNVVKAGSAIPVKFSLGGNFGLNIFAAGSPSVASLACPAQAPTDAIETTVSATANSLSYSAVTGQYTYVWKTDKGFAGSCRQLVLKFSDGTTKTATFNFTR